MKKFRGFYLLTLIAAYGFMFSIIIGCNATGDVDEPEGRDQLLNQALAKMDQGNCPEANLILEKIGSEDDEIERTRGWAQLCLAGATVNKITQSLFAYNTNSSNLTVIGDLANHIVPQDTTSLGHISSAIISFEKQADSNDRAVNIALAHLVKAAAIIAKNRTAGASIVSRSDIATSACNGVNNCTTGSGSCTVNAEGRMSNSDASDLRDEIVRAQTALTGKSSLGEAQDLINRLGQDITSSVTNNFTRCMVVNTMLSN